MAGRHDVIAIAQRFGGVEVTTSCGRPALKVAGTFMCSVRQNPDAWRIRAPKRRVAQLDGG